MNERRPQAPATRLPVTRLKGTVAWLDRHAEEAIAGACVVMLAVFLFAQVVMRYVFRSPLSWSDELATYAMVGLVYFGAAYAVRERAHIRVLGALWLMPGGCGIAITLIADLIWIAFNVLMGWQSALLVATFATQPFYSAALEINLLWPHIVVPVGFTLMTLRLVQLYWSWWRGGPAPWAEAR